MTSLTQKEYLKKYLGIGKDSKQKKKKKKEKTVGNGLKVVDEDLDVALLQEIKDDLSAANEDAPQIVAIIDDRPPSLRVDEETKSNLWKPIGEPSDVSGNQLSMKMSSSFKLNSTNKPSLLKNDSHKTFKKPTSKYKEDKNYAVASRKYVSSSKDDYSPPRKTSTVDSRVHKSKTVDDSPPREIKREKLSPIINDDVDISPPRKKRDLSPPRKNKYKDIPQQRGNKSKDNDNSPPRSHNSNDLSSPRSNKGIDNRKRDEDISPPRRTTQKDSLSPRRNEGRDNDSDNSPPRKTPRDLSPPRKKNRDRDISPPRRHRSPDHRSDRLNKHRHSDDKDNSPPRKVSRDLSPPRRNRDRSKSPRRTERLPLADKIKKEREESPARPNKGRKSRWADNSPSSSGATDKIEKTLSGKRAGLQDARGITKELTALREREDELFRNMSDDVSGANATTIVRGKKQVDPEEQAAQKLKEKEMKEKYDRWGKGLKQVDDQNQKLSDQLHEMSKPLARYADDEDLERYLKEQEREGDPMLAYIRKKKRKTAVDAGVPEKLQYMGEFMPNRFGIVPGYRWDGVDRSNGYERKWFETQNKKRAMQEEAHKWSTEDM